MHAFCHLVKRRVLILVGEILRDRNDHYHYRNGAASKNFSVKKRKDKRKHKQQRCTMTIRLLPSSFYPSQHTLTLIHMLTHTHTQTLHTHKYTHHTHTHPPPHPQNKHKHPPPLPSHLWSPNHINLAGLPPGQGRVLDDLIPDGAQVGRDGRRPRPRHQTVLLRPQRGGGGTGLGGGGGSVGCGGAPWNQVGRRRRQSGWQRCDALLRERGEEEAELETTPDATLSPPEWLLMAVMRATLMLH